MDEHFAKDIRYHAAIAHEYDTVVTEPRAFANDLLFGALDALISPGLRMLDLGCGTGQMLLRYASRFTEAVGVDHSTQMLTQARSNLVHANLTKVRLEHSDLLDFLAAEKQSAMFDLITCVGCLHHFPHPEIPHALAAMTRRLASGGALLFAEPIDVSADILPSEIAQWNAESVMRERGYSLPAEDPDEGPLSLTLLSGALADAGLVAVAENRGWEMFPQHLPPRLSDRVALWKMHHRHGATGNIYAAVAMRPVDF